MVPDPEPSAMDTTLDNTIEGGDYNITGEGGYKWGKMMKSVGGAGRKFMRTDGGRALTNQAIGALSGYNPALGMAAGGAAAMARGSGYYGFAHGTGRYRMRRSAHPRKRTRRVSGRGFYKLRSGRMPGAPFRNASKIVKLGQNSTPVRFHASRSELGGVQIINQEFVTTIYGNPNAKMVQSTTFMVNPGLSTVFPMLSQFASNFELYRLKQCIFHFETVLDEGVFQSATGQVGSVMMASHINPDNPDLQTVGQYMGQYGPDSVANATKGLTCGVECDRKQMAGLSNAGFNKIRTGPLPAGAQTTDYDQAKFQFGVAETPSTLANVPIGRLWVSYTVELAKPRLHAVLGRNMKVDFYRSKSYRETIAQIIGTDGQQGIPAPTALPPVVAASIPAEGQKEIIILKHHDLIPRTPVPGGDGKETLHRTIYVDTASATNATASMPTNTVDDANQKTCSFFHDGTTDIKSVQPMSQIRPLWERNAQNTMDTVLIPIHMGGDTISTPLDALKDDSQPEATRAIVNKVPDLSKTTGYGYENDHAVRSYGRSGFRLVFPNTLQGVVRVRYRAFFKRLAPVTQDVITGRSAGNTGAARDSSQAKHDTLNPEAIGLDNKSNAWGCFTNLYCGGNVKTVRMHPKIDNGVREEYEGTYPKVNIENSTNSFIRDATINQITGCCGQAKTNALDGAISAATSLTAMANQDAKLATYNSGLLMEFEIYLRMSMPNVGQNFIDLYATGNPYEKTLIRGFQNHGVKSQDQSYVDAAATTANVGGNLGELKRWDTSNKMSDEVRYVPDFTLEVQQFSDFGIVDNSIQDPTTWEELEGAVPSFAKANRVYRPTEPEVKFAKSEIPTNDLQYEY